MKSSSQITNLVTAVLIVQLGISSIVKANETSAPVAAPITKPYRTFITIQRYNLEHSGNPGTAIQNAKLEISFSDGTQAVLPENGHYWPINNGQSQEINRTFEVPPALIQSDTTLLSLKMIRSGSKTSPCEFKIEQIPQFNRAYICRTDVAAQTQQHKAEDRIVKESVEIRVFTDRNTPASELPKNAIALTK